MPIDDSKGLYKRLLYNSMDQSIHECPFFFNKP